MISSDIPTISLNILLGDGVNIAARLEALAEPGGICVSGAVHDEIGTKVTVSFVELADPQMKNIAQPVRTYRVEGKATVTDTATVARPLALPDKPSIAVLPFQNMSGDPEQEYFVDGMVEEIITALSRIRWLFVIALWHSHSTGSAAPAGQRPGAPRSRRSRWARLSPHARWRLRARPTIGPDRDGAAIMWSP